MSPEMICILIGLALGLTINLGGRRGHVRRGHGYQPKPRLDGKPEGLNPPTGGSSVMPPK